MKSKVLLLLLAMLAAGCVAENGDPADGNRADRILDYYMPRNTELRYVYNYYGYFSGKGDSTFIVDYRGISSSIDRVSTDTLAPIHQFSVSSADEKHRTDFDLYVSDSMIVEYGRDCSVQDERFVPLSSKLVIGEQWRAAQGYKAGKGYTVSFIATVAAHYKSLEVARGVSYDDVWQVNYRVTGSDTSNVKPAQEFLPNARRAIYFAKGVGKILEISFSPDNKPQWETKLIRVDRR